MAASPEAPGTHRLAQVSLWALAEEELASPWALASGAASSWEAGGAGARAAEGGDEADEAEEVAEEVEVWDVVD